MNVYKIETIYVSAIVYCNFCICCYLYLEQFIVEESEFFFSFLLEYYHIC